MGNIAHAINVTLYSGQGFRRARRLSPSMEVTRRLARFVVGSQPADIPQAVRHEATRSIVNWLGCAPAVRATMPWSALGALRAFAGPPPQSSVIGRRERLDSLHAALINGMSAHVLDFDDTHLRTLLHPSVPVASSLLALAERLALSGAAFVHAFVLGVEVECRIANAIYAAHNVNWYITGTPGGFGAAAAVGRVLGLDEQQMTWAFGIAATQAAGLREMAGTISLDCPMSDSDLEHKFLALAEHVLPSAQADALIEKCWHVSNLVDVAELARIAVPE